LNLDKCSFPQPVLTEQKPTAYPFAADEVPLSPRYTGNRYFFQSITEKAVNSRNSLVDFSALRCHNRQNPRPTDLREELDPLAAKKFVLVLGTRNKKKRRELEYLLSPYQQVELKSLDEFPDAIEVEETGTTFAENAALKATQQATHLGQFVLGEDSGLSVAALDGRPGVYSARYAGENANDETNKIKLIEELNGVPLAKRLAWYTCHMTLSDPQGNVLIDCESQCRGRILDAERGDAGFGYDPLFEIPEYGLTFAELGDEVKSVLSHRAKANRFFVPQLLSLVASL